MNGYKWCIDLAAVANVIATLVGWLPAVAALLSIIWTAAQLYQMWKKR